MHTSYVCIVIQNGQTKLEALYFKKVLLQAKPTDFLLDVNLSVSSQQVLPTSLKMYVPKYF